MLFLNRPMEFLSGKELPLPAIKWRIAVVVSTNARHFQVDNLAVQPRRRPVDVDGSDGRQSRRRRQGQGRLAGTSYGDARQSAGCPKGRRRRSNWGFQSVCAPMHLAQRQAQDALRFVPVSAALRRAGPWHVLALNPGVEIISRRPLPSRSRTCAISRHTGLT